jgi:ketosteroid isomerase-like protein
LTTNHDKTAIRKLIDDWCAAVRRRDYDGVLKWHSPDILMFDVPGPFRSEAIEAYRKTGTSSSDGCQSRRSSSSRISA